MKYVRFRSPLTLVCITALATGCAVAPKPDPRSPGPVTDSPELLRVCIVDGDGAHLVVGDQVELDTSGSGRLRIRHIPGPDNRDGAWNGGEAVKVRSAVLVERVDPRGNNKNTRRFVPVGRFAVRVGATDTHAAPFDFLASKATESLTNNKYAECNVELGDDEVLIRGVADSDRHGGDVHLR